MALEDILIDGVLSYMCFLMRKNQGNIDFYALIFDPDMLEHLYKTIIHSFIKKHSNLIVDNQTPPPQTTSILKETADIKIILAPKEFDLINEPLKKLKHNKYKRELIINKIGE
jgi:hypothetical protein